MSVSIKIICRRIDVSRPTFDFDEKRKGKVEAYCSDADLPHLLKQVAKILGHDDSDENIQRTLARLGK